MTEHLYCIWFAAGSLSHSSTIHWVFCTFLEPHFLNIRTLHNFGWYMPCLLFHPTQFSYCHIQLAVRVVPWQCLEFFGKKIWRIHRNSSTSILQLGTNVIYHYSFVIVLYLVSCFVFGCYIFHLNQSIYTFHIHKLYLL